MECAALFAVAKMGRHPFKAIGKQSFEAFSVCRRKYLWPLLIISQWFKNKIIPVAHLQCDYRFNTGLGIMSLCKQTPHLVVSMS